MARLEHICSHGKNSYCSRGKSYRVALKFRGSLISRILQIWSDSQNYFKDFFLHFCKDRRVHRPTIYRFGTSRAWMDSIRGPSCQITQDRSPSKCPHPQFLRQAAKSLYFSHLPVQSSGKRTGNERREGRNWKASSRAWIASHNSLLSFL